MINILSVNHCLKAMDPNLIQRFHLQKAVYDPKGVHPFHSFAPGWITQTHLYKLLRLLVVLERNMGKRREPAVLSGPLNVPHQHRIDPALLAAVVKRLANQNRTKLPHYIALELQSAFSCLADDEDSLEHQHDFVTKRKEVRFGTLEIRHYKVVWDNSSPSRGPSMTLGWQYLSSAAVTIDEYEETRPPRRTRRELRIPLHPEKTAPLTIPQVVAVSRPIKEVAEDSSQSWQQQQESLEQYKQRYRNWKSHLTEWCNCLPVSVRKPQEILLRRRGYGPCSVE